jgi:hypothetical protein
MKLSTSSKVRILEDFYAIDYTLLGKNITKCKKCNPELVEEYLSVKGALISTMIEMFKLVGHNPKVIYEQVTDKRLANMARESAQIARNNCKKLVASKKGRESIKTELREALSNPKNKNRKVNLESIVNRKIKQKAFRLAIDNLLIARTITESKSYKNLNSWSGKIIEDAYKILRDNLTDIAIKLSN